MKTKRAKYADIPSNFDIRKYDVCAEWDLSWWVANLYRRIVTGVQIDGEMEGWVAVWCAGKVVERLPTSGSPDLKHRQILREMTADRFDDPELNWGNSDEGPIDGFLGSPPALAQRVRDVSALEILSGNEIFNDDSTAKYAEAYRLSRTKPTSQEEHDAIHEAINMLDSTPEWKMWLDWGTEEADLGPFAFANVDLMAPDDVIVDDFRRWLAQARQRMGIAPRPLSFAQSDIDNWVKMRVLAYIDLTAWARAHDFEIPLPVIGRALFPDEFDIGLADRVRKVVARDARYLMSMETIRSMQSQHLKTERERAKSIPDL